ncbi:PREDICTED: uncharacterized protein LOC108509745 isoform X1 [Lepidothrix coronata]|uniref:Uncharacterized protein LOC108509745 isoform X1 n=1 Tax=Lepidothrix coronata TaxID=321398 RepID=A0A6J0J775_9PASS|nr:PREDICTED: uncharacterized protein LOC108509745 isoform X1 [Lepidothrix coronata]
MERGLGLEQRAERLVRRRWGSGAAAKRLPDLPSQVLLRPRPRGPEGAEPLLSSAPADPAPVGPVPDDPLIQWRLRRRRGEELALDTCPVGGATHWESREPSETPSRGRFCTSHRQGPTSSRPHSQESLQWEPYLRSRDATGALWGAPCWVSRDPQDALRPIRSSVQDAQQGAPSRQALVCPQDPVLRLLRCHRRVLREQLWTVETLLEPTRYPPQPGGGQ